MCGCGALMEVLLCLHGISVKIFAVDKCLNLCDLRYRLLPEYVFRHKKVAKIFGGFAESA